MTMCKRCSKNEATHMLSTTGLSPPIFWCAECVENHGSNLVSVTRLGGDVLPIKITPLAK